MAAPQSPSHNLRIAELTREVLLDSPFTQLEEWLRDAVCSGIKYPTAMTLATVGTDGNPDQRTVLLKHCDNKGLVFYANDASKKIHDLLRYPSVSAHFPWHHLDRQVRICGRAEKVSAAETTQYFVTQPRYERQPSGSGSGGRNFLIQQFEMMRSKFYGGGDRAPGHWSGYRIVPSQFEFWQGGGPRLRDRFQYKIEPDGKWHIEQLWE